MIHILSFQKTNKSRTNRPNSNKVPLNIVVPRGRDFKYPYPFTSHGFTAGKKGELECLNLRRKKVIKYPLAMALRFGR